MQIGSPQYIGDFVGCVIWPLGLIIVGETSSTFTLGRPGGARDAQVRLEGWIQAVLRPSGHSYSLPSIVQHKPHVRLSEFFLAFDDTS